MAAKKNAAKPQSAPSAAAEPAAGAKKPQAASFDAFNGEDVNVPDIDGWYSPEENEAGWVGRIVGMFRMKDTFNEGKMRDIVVVRLLSACSSAVDSDGGEPCELEPGHAMAISVKAKLLGLLEYVEKRGTVAVRAIEKKVNQQGSIHVDLCSQGPAGRKGPARPAREPELPADTGRLRAAGFLGRDGPSTHRTAAYGTHSHADSRGLAGVRLGRHPEAP